MADKDRSDWKEKKVEAYLKKEVAKLGGLSMKWVCPSHRGVPDQIVMYQGKVFYVEVKTLTGKLTPLQEKCHQMLRDQGFCVAAVYGADGVDEFIRLITGQTNA